MLETKPKPGSKVRCVNTGGHRFLTKGNVYETSDGDGDNPMAFFFLDDDGDAIWHMMGVETEEFELVEEEEIMNNTTETKADDFKVGDQVWCAMHGRGVVEHVCFDDMLSVGVSLDNGDFNWYTKDGKYNIDLNRTLFFSEPKIEASVVRPFVPALEGKYVVVETGDGSVNGRVFEETSTHFKLDGGYSFAKAVCHAIYEVSSENLLK